MSIIRTYGKDHSEILHCLDCAASMAWNDVLDGSILTHQQWCPNRNPITGVASSTDCRSEEGINVGLIDSIITAARVLKLRRLQGHAVREALKDLRSDRDVAFLMRTHQPESADPDLSTQAGKFDSSVMQAAPQPESEKQESAMQSAMRRQKYMDGEANG